MDGWRVIWSARKQLAQGMDGTKITRQRGWTDGELYGRHENNSLKD